jgi:hypothetical protein
LSYEALVRGLASHRVDDKYEYGYSQFNILWNRLGLPLPLLL